MPALPQKPRWFLDENSLGVAQALQHVRGDITWPGAPDNLIPKGADDPDWLPVVGSTGLVVLTRDKKIRTRPIERQTLLRHNVRAFFQTSGGNLTLFDQLRVWLRYWDNMEELVANEPGPWLASVTGNGVRIFAR
jgi:hypothetical protein